MKHNQNDVAKITGWSVAFLSQLLSGKRNIRSLNDAKVTSARLKKHYKIESSPTVWMHGGGTPKQRRQACGLEVSG